MAEICELHARLIDNLRLGMSVFLNGSVRDAQKLLEEKARFRDLERAYAATHLDAPVGQHGAEHRDQFAAHRPDQRPEAHQLAHLLDRLSRSSNRPARWRPAGCAPMSLPATWKVGSRAPSGLRAGGRTQDASGRLEFAACLHAVVDQRVDLGGLVEHGVGAQLRAAAAHVGRRVVAQHDHLLAGPASAAGLPGCSGRCPRAGTGRRSATSQSSVVAGPASACLRCSVSAMPTARPPPAPAGSRSGSRGWSGCLRRCRL